VKHDEPEQAAETTEKAERVRLNKRFTSK